MNISVGDFAAACVVLSIGTTAVVEPIVSHDWFGPIES